MSICECSFLIPVCGDADLSDGKTHSRKLWKWLKNELYVRFQGGTCFPGTVEGFYRDPDTGQRVTDQSRRFVVAVPDERLHELRKFLSACCVMFAQKCIYLSVAGKVEFIGPP